jgi:hypothetical protein
MKEQSLERLLRTWKIMYQRIVCFKFKKTASEHAIQAHMKDLAGLKETIPQIVNYKGGLTVATQADGEPEWDSVHYLTFVIPILNLNIP